MSDSDVQDHPRLQRYLDLNIVMVWISVVALLILRLTLVDSASLTQDTVALSLSGLALVAAAVLVRRGRRGAAAVLVVLTTWALALALTWITPFILPVSLLALLLPVIIFVEHLPVSLRLPTTIATAVLAGALAAMGQVRHHHPDVNQPQPGLAAALVGVFVPLVVGLVLYGIAQHMRRLTRQARELKRSRARLARTALDARRGIERDLHDGAQQRLAAIAVDLGRATRLAESDPVAHASLTALQSQLHEAIRELRDLARGIYPALLTERGLPGALPAAARRTTLPCAVDVSQAGRHTAVVEAATYFCCMEAIHNADRHSKGSMISVAVSGGADHPEGLHFSVSDDGVGLPPTQQRGGSGLLGMRDRIRAAGGELLIASSGKGTTVSGHFPPGTSVT